VGTKHGPAGTLHAFRGRPRVLSFP
jgi:hypothetical protein